eukprot:EG_transcript_25668
MSPQLPCEWGHRVRQSPAATLPFAPGASSAPATPLRGRSSEPNRRAAALPQWQLFAPARHTSHPLRSGTAACNFFGFDGDDLLPSSRRCLEERQSQDSLQVLDYP